MFFNDSYFYFITYSKKYQSNNTCLFNYSLINKPILWYILPKLRKFKDSLKSWWFMDVLPALFCTLMVGLNFAEKKMFLYDTRSLFLEIFLFFFNVVHTKTITSIITTFIVIIRVKWPMSSFGHAKNNLCARYIFIF